VSASSWPPIDEPELRRRLTLDDAAFRSAYCGFLRSVGPRTCTERDLRRALAYPWARPASSFRLAGDAVEPLDRPASAQDREDRVPLLAIGSNGAPRTLVRKLAHLGPPDRALVVEAGDLHDFDVVATTFPTVYGSFAATLVPSPGTVLRAALVWVTPRQLTALSWTETSYRLGRLTGARFESRGAAGPAPPALHAFVSRWGALARDGAPVPLAALPARRRARAGLTQEQLRDEAAAATLGARARAGDLVRAIFADLTGTARRLEAVLGARAVPFAAEGWEPYGR
jgi:hypothetical protein